MSKDKEIKKEELSEEQKEQQEKAEEYRKKVPVFLDEYRELSEKHGLDFRAVLRAGDTSIRSELSIVPRPESEEEEAAE
tara:strand:- start:200 stop:436 length:237 start_codon:yes stop_codon:yes gene_type:complete